MPEPRFSQRPLVVAIVLLVLASILLLRGIQQGGTQKRPRPLARGPIARPVDNTEAALDKAREDYLRERASLLQAGGASMCGADLKLDDDELKANEYLVGLRDQVLSSYKKKDAFPPVQGFLAAKAAIESTGLLQLLRRMPKGGVLHIHTLSAGRASWVVENAASRPDCYVYWGDDGGEHLKGQLGFYLRGSQPAGFRPVREVRGEVADFDRQLLDLVTLGADDAGAPDVRKRFTDVLRRLRGFLRYRPVFMEYYREAFQTLLADNVQYVELRAGIGPLYDLNGNTWTPEESVDLFQKIRDEVRVTHPEFDLKLILAYYREESRASVWDNLQQAVKLRTAYPNFVVGFDLAGEDGTGRTALYYLDDWLRLRTLEANGVSLPLYFHDGEDDWPDDENLYDAYLLRCRRIGHGFSLFRSPRLEQATTEANIPLEVCPLGSQILGLAPDLRNHPAGGYLRRGVPCVIGSDDPGVFGYEGLSYDFWAAMVAWKLDLRALKKLAINSIDYSAMNPQEKENVMSAWNKRWSTFIGLVLDEATKAGAPKGK
jgi:adenosine deaminase CECR1